MVHACASPAKVNTISKDNVDDDDDDISPIEEVSLTVLTTDDPSLSVWMFLMWFLGVLSCALLSFLNQFFAYRTEPLVINQITVQVASLPIGHFLAKVLPTTKFECWATSARSTPGPFNMKEHALISIFINAGCALARGLCMLLALLISSRIFIRGIFPSGLVGFLLSQNKLIN